MEESSHNNFQKQEYTELLASENQSQIQPSRQNHLTQSQSINKHTENIQQVVIDPIHQLKANDNIMPLLAIIDKVDLNMCIDGKPLICILCTKFIPLSIIFKDIQVKLKNDQDNRSPLHYAIEADDVKAAAWCIQKNNPNKKDNFDNTPILDAIRLGRKRCFLLCLKNKYYDQRAPLTAAIYNRVWEMKVLYSHNYSIKQVRDQHNRGPLEKAVQYNSFQTAQFLININPQANVQKLSSLTESQGIIRKLKKIQSQSSLFHSTYLPLIKPLLVFLAIYIGINAKFSTQNLDYEPYTQTRPIYLTLMLLIFCFYVILYVLGVSCSNVRYTSKNRINQILKQPNYPTLQQICPICFRLTTSDHRQDHCYKCGCCVQKFHKHEFVCVNASNEVVWFMMQIFWLFLVIKLLLQFNLYCSQNYLELTKFEGSSLFFFAAQLELFVINSMYLNLIWLTFLITLFFHQLAIITVLLGMLTTGRTYQQIIQTEKYIHMYKIVKNKQQKYVNKEIKIFQKGFLKGLCIVWQNSMLYFFK